MLEKDPKDWIMSFKGIAEKKKEKSLKNDDLKPDDRPSSVILVSSSQAEDQIEEILDDDNLGVDVKSSKISDYLRN